MVNRTSRAADVDRSSPPPVEAGNAAADGAGVRSVQRALEILNLLSEERPQVTIREIVEDTGLAKTTAIRLTQTLVHAGLLWATPTGYMAGPGLWRWGHLARSVWELPPEFSRMMADMAREHQETVNLYIRRDIHRLCIAHAESPRALRHVVNVGDEFPMWAGASAKVLLADAPESLLARIVAAAPRGRGDLERLRAAVAESREAGFAVSHGERESGVSAVAVPVADESGRIVAALSMSGATTRFTNEHVEVFASALRNATVAISGRGLGTAVRGAIA
jgi:DNA-binding IclR family transcriptional regulator